MDKCISRCHDLPKRCEHCPKREEYHNMEKRTTTVAAWIVFGLIVLAYILVYLAI